MSAAFIWGFLIGVVTGGGWGLVAGLRNARDIALQTPPVPSTLPRIGGPQQQKERA